MDYLLIAVVTLIGAGLTLFSGFGLGTLLLPVFGLFFPIELAIALTAVVHFANNLIKVWFFRKHFDWKIIAIFGIPSMFAAYLGAKLLTVITDLNPLFSYTLSGHEHQVTPVKLIVAVLLVVFSLFDLLPNLGNFQIKKKYLPVGGLLSGFFGGLSGHQGALRSAFLIRAGLSKEVFIGTGVVIACLIDISRLTVYSRNMLSHISQSEIMLLVVAVVAAFTGVFIGNRLFKKITIKTLHVVVAIMILIFAVLLGSGII